MAEAGHTRNQPSYCSVVLCLRVQSMASLKLPSISSHAPLLLFLLFLSSSLNTTLSFAAEFISFNHSLSGSQTITSLGGKFVLGFFRPGNESSHEYYIGIWYNKIPKLTPVWVANRETPISDPTLSELRISDDGNLVLLSQSKTPIWSTNLASIGTNSTVAVIQDSGNLVLRDGSDPSMVFWQSFNHPTDTMLPGAKFGLNKVTGEMQRLISWKNSEDPAPGIFSFEIDPAGSSQFFILWNGTKRFWSTGYYNGKIYSAVPEMTQHHLVNLEYVFNSTINYFTYSLMDERTILRFVMDLSGQIKVSLWVENEQDWVFFWTEPKNQCDVYSICGPFGICDEKSLPFCTCVKGFHEASPPNWDLEDRSGGCVRNASLQCGTNGSIHGEKDKFYPMPSIGLPDNPHSLAVASAEDCEFACSSDCSCTAYSYDGGCSVWHRDLVNLQLQSSGSGGETLYLRLAASELPISKPMKQRAKWIIPTAVAGGVAVLAFVLLLIWSHRRRQTKLRTDRNLVVFAYRDLQRMTKDFSEKLGEGGFGSVFKGTLPDSAPVAVKKLEGLLRQGEKQFRAEVSTIGTTHHVNLVRLRGFCCERNKRLLVYEYMPNGSLDSQLFHSRSLAVGWSTRYQIAVGTARGLAYLHEKCRDCIIHCDVKPENILLDASFVPKVADFGLAKLVGRDFSRVLTTARGTIGYLAPEWISGCPITSKADVFSYGMMLLEIISGRRNMEPSEKGRATYFPVMAARKLVKEEDVLSLLDHRLEGNANWEELNRACKIACWCIQEEESYRPSMGQVVQVLEGVAEVNIPPLPRLVQIFDESSGSRL